MTEKLMNQSQGEDIISNLGSIATSLSNIKAISPAKFGMGYAVCDTAASTAAKTANIANYTLTEGALVTVKFTNGSTASNATLNISNTGAKPLLYKGSAITGEIIGAGDICTFIYSTANSGSYSIINIDALSGAGAGTVKSVGAEGGIITDQTEGAAISTTGSVKLNLKSNTAFESVAPDPVTTEGRIYPVALDSAGHPAVDVPWTDTTYTKAANSAITVDNTNHTIGVAAGTTTTAGVVQLADSYTSTDTDKAATPKAVKAAYDLANGKYAKPYDGIPASDLTTAVQTSLTAADNAVPNTRKINNTALSADITLTAASVGAVPTSRTVNSKALSSDITLSGDDIKLTSYTKGSSTAAVAATDKVNAAIAKHENRLDQQNSDLAYVLGRTGKNAFSFTVQDLKTRWSSQGTWNNNVFTPPTQNYTITVVDNEYIRVAGTSTANTSYTIGTYDPTLWKGWVFSGGTTNVSTTTCIMGVNNISYDYGNGVTLTADSTRAIQIAIFAATFDVTFKPMICTAEDWAISHNFVPYAKSNYQLTTDIGNVNAVLEAVL